MSLVNRRRRNAVKGIENVSGKIQIRTLQFQIYY